MAQVSEKDLSLARRRTAAVANHLVPATSGSNSGSVGLNNASMSDSYHRIHGEVPSHDVVWRVACDEFGKEFTDIIYEKADGEGIAKITINRPKRSNAFRPQTTKELIRAFNDVRDDSSVRVIILTGTKAFCSGGDQALRTKDGYADCDDFGPLNVLDLQVLHLCFRTFHVCSLIFKALLSQLQFGGSFLRLLQRPHYIYSVLNVQIRHLPKPVIAMVAGYAVGGGHILHTVCDLTIDNAIFSQTGPKVGSFDAGYGSSVMSRLVSTKVGHKRARERWFLTRFYTATEADKMGLLNTVVPLENLERETIRWCREILRNSPTAIRVLKSALNAVDDGHAGLQELGGNAILIFYGTEEGNEGETAYVERRRPDFSKFPRRP